LATTVTTAPLEMAVSSGCSVLLALMPAAMLAAN
jgi:hypothetical protein